MGSLMVIIKAVSMESFLGLFYVFEAKPLNQLSVQGTMKSFYFADGGPPYLGWWGDAQTGTSVHFGGDMANTLLFKKHLHLGLCSVPLNKPDSVVGHKIFRFPIGGNSFFKVSKIYSVLSKGRSWLAMPRQARPCRNENNHPRC